MKHCQEDERLFGECLDSFVRIISEKKSMTHAKKLAKERRYELIDPSLADEIFDELAGEECEYELEKLEAERIESSPVTSAENLKLFIDSRTLIEVLEKMPEKLMKSLVIGIGFGYDNAAVADMLDIKPDTAKSYRSQALRSATERMVAHEED